jgi:hypothetical protein
MKEDTLVGMKGVPNVVSELYGEDILVNSKLD